MKHKVKNALYNALLHYWSLSDGKVFLACLLDLKCKKLWFATPQQHEAEAALRTKYNNAKSLYQSSTTSSNKSFSTNEDQDRREGCQIYQKSENINDKVSGGFRNFESKQCQPKY
ncbi:8392_t:CDS:2 [Gigaspora margarita]|uniref:8392_t:CDS:1 n=1 Tax=Gigaspora margarita TaxID=4874 RepID=A0ABN7VYZ2_GIGMA|nr:8392_t:CDS:2 [Gigaspora margarita]